MELKVLTINEDGTANCEVEMTNEELISMAKVGIITALREAIKDMDTEKYNEGEDREISELDRSVSDS